MGEGSPVLRPRPPSNAGRIYRCGWRCSTAVVAAATSVCPSSLSSGLAQRLLAVCWVLWPTAEPLLEQLPPPCLVLCLTTTIPPPMGAAITTGALTEVLQTWTLLPLATLLPLNAPLPWLELCELLRLIQNSASYPHLSRSGPLFKIG